MSKKAFITELDDLLKPIGFVRHKATWNRRTDAVVDVIDIQVSKSADRVTVNAGVLDPDVYATLWAEAPSMFVQSPMCTVNARIGELIDGRDKWWPLDDRGSPLVVAANVAERVLPFLERLHTREAMELWLIDTEVVEKQYPPPILSLAILKCFLGRPADGCGLLAEREQKATGPWRVRSSRSSGRGATSSRTNGRASVRAGPESSSFVAHHMFTRTGTLRDRGHGRGHLRQRHDVPDAGHGRVGEASVLTVSPATPIVAAAAAFASRPSGQRAQHFSLEPSMLRASAAFAALCTLVGCATIVHGTRQDIGLSSSPTAATVVVDNVPMGTTPVITKLSRKDHHIIRMELQGYAPFEATVRRSVSGWVWGNIVFGGLIGLAVDAISGGLYKLTPDQIAGQLAVIGGSVTQDEDGIYLFVVMQPADKWERVGTLDRD